MARTTSVISFSVPPELGRQTERVAKKYHMTRSELLRDALRQYTEGLSVYKILSEYERDKKLGKLKKLRGSIVDLMKVARSA